MAYDVGDVWTPELTVKDAAGVLTAATVTVQATSPSGTTSTPVVTNTGTGTYEATVLLTEVGAWKAVWTVSGAVTGSETQFSHARRAGSNIIGVQEVKDRLDKTLTVDDAEIVDMIDAAIAEYETYVGPVSGTVVEKHSGGGPLLVLGNINASTIVTAEYSDGTVIDVADLDLDTRTGMLHWGYGTAGVFTFGSRNVTVTYTVGGVPANHREAVIADIAGYFAATQQGPSGPDDDLGYAATFRTSPSVMFPRIRALAAPAIA